MSNGRKSFLLHFDSLGILDQLTDEQCGKLFLACRDYNLGEELKLDATLELVFFPFKAQFIRDKEKYEKLCEKNRLIAENRYKTKSTTGTSGNQPLPQDTKSTDNDSDSDSDSGNDSDSDIKPIVDRKKSPIPYQQIADMYNQILGAEFKAIVKLDVGTRKAKIKKFWNDMGKDMAECERYFTYFGEQAEPWQKGLTDRKWTADIEYIVKDTTVEKMRAG